MRANFVTLTARLMITLSVLTMVSFSSPVSANETDCGSSTMEMHECIGAKLLVADKELNSVYQALRTRLKKEAADEHFGNEALETDRRLVAAQRAWITFRDADCQLEATQMLGGSGEGLIVHGCLLNRTQERVKALKAY